MIGKLTAVLAFSLAWLAAPAVWADPGSDQRECCDYNGFYAGLGGGLRVRILRRRRLARQRRLEQRARLSLPATSLALELQLEYTSNFNGKSGRLQWRRHLDLVRAG